jgi:hypothetical protein
MGHSQGGMMDKKKFDVVIIASVIPARFPLLLRSLETWITAAEYSGLTFEMPNRRDPK